MGFKGLGQGSWCFKNVTFLLACLQGKHALELFLFFVNGRISRNGPGPGAIEASCLSLLLDAISDAISNGNPRTDNVLTRLIRRKGDEKEETAEPSRDALCEREYLQDRFPGIWSLWKPMFSERQTLCELIELSSLPLLPQVAWG